MRSLCRPARWYDGFLKSKETSNKRAKELTFMQVMTFAKVGGWTIVLLSASYCRVEHYWKKSVAGPVFAILYCLNN